MNSNSSNKKLYTKRFYPAGTYTWEVPSGCKYVDVFLVGGGGGAGDTMPGGGGYTKTFKKDSTGWKDGNEIQVSSGQQIEIIVGKGGTGALSGYSSTNGGYSQFMNSSYRAEGGKAGSGSGSSSKGGDGGSGASAWYGTPGTDGSNGTGSGFTPGYGQGHTTRDFGDPTGKRNAGGGSCNRASSDSGGATDYSEGSGGNSYTTSDDTGFVGRIIKGGGGYGGGGSGASYPSYVGNGGDGTVLIRYYAY